MARFTQIASTAASVRSCRLHRHDRLQTRRAFLSRRTFLASAMKIVSTRATRTATTVAQEPSIPSAITVQASDHCERPPAYCLLGPYSDRDLFAQIALTAATACLCRHHRQGRLHRHHRHRHSTDARTIARTRLTRPVTTVGQVPSLRIVISARTVRTAATDYGITSPRATAHPPPLLRRGSCHALLAAGLWSTRGSTRGSYPCSRPPTSVAAH